MAQVELARFIDRNTAENVCFYPHPVERVWRAITDPAEFAVWFIPGRIELKVGGAYVFGPPDNPHMQGVILALEPPRLIRFQGANGNWFQYELEEAAGGTRMRFTEYYPPGVYPDQSASDPIGGDLPAGTDTSWYPGRMGGWHGFFDGLGDYLNGKPLGAGLPPTEMSHLVSSWAEEKVRGDEIDRETADRYKRELRLQEDWDRMAKAYRAHIKANCPPV
jgi:uncharacterized protein YndB with AHSA1/START domain